MVPLSAPASDRSVNSSLAFGPSKIPPWIRPRFKRSVSEPGEPVGAAKHLASSGSRCQDDRHLLSERGERLDHGPRDVPASRRFNDQPFFDLSA